MKNHYQVLVIGGGTAGIMTSAQLLKKNPKLDIGIIEPSDTHAYQPAWTLVGVGDYKKSASLRPMSRVIPKKATWIKDRVVSLDPDHKAVVTQISGSINYDYLILASGLEMAPELIPGLPESLGKGMVCSNYTDPEHSWEALRKFKGGQAIFTQPATPIKCGGAPQKMAYMSCDYLRKQGLLDKTKAVFATPGTVLFGIPEILKTLNKVVDRYGLQVRTRHKPIRIDADKQVIQFEYTGDDPSYLENDHIHQSISVSDEGKTLIEMHFDFLHLAPPQRAPKFIRESKLANDAGWVEVDQYGLESPNYPGVFALGDNAGTPAAKTGAAVRKQAPVVADSILKSIEGKSGDKKYNGYSSCPLITGYGKMTLAEFDYSNKFTPDPKLKQLLIQDSSKESWRLWMLKKYGLPYLYWNKMIKGQDI